MWERRKRTLMIDEIKSKMLKGKERKQENERCLKNEYAHSIIILPRRNEPLNIGLLS